MKQEKERYYRLKELHELYGYPYEKLKTCARQINRRSSPDAERGFNYKLTLKEAEHYFGY